MTIKIKGKDYVTVDERISHFRKTVPGGRIITEFLLIDDDQVIMQATVYDGDVPVATGHAEEKWASSQINKTSAVENCETSAIGRALGIFGIGLGGSVATADEVQNAIHQQKNPPKQPTARSLEPDYFKNKVMGLFLDLGISNGQMRVELGEIVPGVEPDAFTKGDWNHVIDVLEKRLAH